MAIEYFTRLNIHFFPAGEGMHETILFYVDE